MRERSGAPLTARIPLALTVPIPAAASASVAGLPPTTGSRPVPAVPRSAIRSTASSTRESMPRARKSILMKPASSQESLSHWQRTRPSQAAGSRGTISNRGREEMIIPPTCWEMWRGRPAISSASAPRACQRGAFDFSLNSGSVSNSSLRPPAERCSASLVSFSRSPMGSSRTLPISRTAERRR